MKSNRNPDQQINLIIINGMKKCLWTLLLTCSGFITHAQTDSILHRIILIGDGGSFINGKHPVPDAVRKNFSLDKKTTILYLGDNIYDYGLPEPDHSFYPEAKAILDSQLTVVDGRDASVYIIPGNHDWDNAGKGGLQAVLRQQQYVQTMNRPNVKFLPENGCPGPVEIELDNNVVLVIFDSQWWIHPHEKPGPGSDCSNKTTEELSQSLAAIFKKHPGKLVVAASHHPVKSNGVHGGYYSIKQHIFPLTDLKKGLYIPLPVIGSIYPLYRTLIGARQDLPHKNYKKMSGLLLDAASQQPNVVFVAGHEHGLQLIQEDGFCQVVSGSGCKATRVRKKKNGVFAAAKVGFSVIEVKSSKEVTVSFYTVDKTTTEVFKTSLMKLQ